MRIGLNEMLKFSKHFFPEVKSRTFFESCGIADLVVSCMEGRNRKCGEAFAKTGKSFEALEEEMLRGQKLQGTLTVEEVHRILKANNLTQEFPLFNIIYCISFEGAPVESIVDCMSTESKL
jgi:glycerol-3-phosphate dehydrogenase (NAD+)